MSEQVGRVTFNLGPPKTVSYRGVKVLAWRPDKTSWRSARLSDTSDTVWYLQPGNLGYLAVPVRPEEVEEAESKGWHRLYWKNGGK